MSWVQDGLFFCQDFMQMCYEGVLALSVQLFQLKYFFGLASVTPLPFNPQIILINVLSYYYYYSWLKKEYIYNNQQLINNNSEITLDYHGIKTKINHGNQNLLKTVVSIIIIYYWYFILLFITTLIRSPWSRNHVKPLRVCKERTSYGKLVFTKFNHLWWVFCLFNLACIYQHRFCRPCLYDVGSRC